MMKESNLYQLAMYEWPGHISPDHHLPVRNLDLLEEPGNFSFFCSAGRIRGEHEGTPASARL
jgi:hypothetical protein